MVRVIHFSLVLFSAFMLTTGCVSFNGKTSAPEITADMPLETLLANAIDFGGETFSRVTTQITTSKRWEESENILASIIMANCEDWQEAQLLNASHLYERTGAKNADLVFLKLIKVNSPAAIRTAWSLVRFADRQKVKSVIDSVLSKAIASNSLEQHLIPEMAESVGLLGVRSVYGVVKLGLIQNGDPQFVRAMIRLKPNAASDDLFDYLALAGDDELRQRALKTINTLAAIQILDYLEKKPFSFGHKDLGKIFAYAASRNIALREIARKVIDGLVGENVEILAYEMSKQPKWIQLSIIESARRTMTSNTKILLKKLQGLTPDENIGEEISLLRL